jgi:hypothetical protein
MLRIARLSLRQIRDFGFAAIFFAVTSTLGNPAAGQNQAPTLDRPPARTVGDTFTFEWHYQNVVRTYIGQKNGLNCYSDKPADGRQSEECFTSDDNLVRRVGTWEPAEYTPSSGELSFPLFVGKQWIRSCTRLDAALHEYLHEVPPAARALTGRTITARVVSFEKVTVPAGAFDAFKILETLSLWGNSAGVYDITEYYSPKLGIIKFDQLGIHWGYKYEGHVELVSYSLAKPGT